MSDSPSVDESTLSAVRMFRDEVSRNYTLMDAYLFGSRSRGTHRPDSDADVAVLLADPAQDFVRTKMDMDDLAFDVLLKTGIRVQPWPVWQEEWRSPMSYSNPRLLLNIARDGVRV